MITFYFKTVHIYDALALKILYIPLRTNKFCRSRILLILIHVVMLSYALVTFFSFNRTCQGTCNPGYEFPDGSRQMTLMCNDREGIWSPDSEFPDCGRKLHICI